MRPWTPGRHSVQPRCAQGFAFPLYGNATTFALRLDGTLLSLLSIQSGPAMICRYFSPNPQEPTSKTTSVMTGGVEHDQGIHRQSLEKLLRLPFQTPPLLLHSQLLLSKIDVLRPATIDAQLSSRLPRPLCTRLLFYRTRRQSFSHFPDHQRAESLHATSAVSASNATSLRAATTRPVRDSESRAVYIERHIAARFRFMSTIEPRGRGGCCLDGWHQSGSIKTVHLARLC
jgi:hypothetical protein